MGIAIRTGSPLSLNLAEPIWKLLAGSQLTPNDITEVSRRPKIFISQRSSAPGSVVTEIKWLIINIINDLLSKELIGNNIDGIKRFSREF